MITFLTTATAATFSVSAVLFLFTFICTLTRTDEKFMEFFVMGLNVAVIGTVFMIALAITEKFIA